MTCPPGCECPESTLAKNGGSDAGVPPTKSRYFVGISPAVLFVATLSVLAFLAVTLAAFVVAAAQTVFFFALPLFSAAGGAFLIAAPERTPLGGGDPTVLLLLRLAGGVVVAYAGSAMLVGRSGCAKIRSAHLALVSASMATLSAALFADGSSALAGKAGAEAATWWLTVGAVSAAASAVMTAAGPAFSRKIQSGKPAEPEVLACSAW
eukprot:g4728.t1